MILDEENIFEYDGEDISSVSFLITSKPHPKRIAGFPLDSISVDMETGKYYIDMDSNEDREYGNLLGKGFRSFFSRSILR